MKSGSEIPLILILLAVMLSVQSYAIGSFGVYPNLNIVSGASESPHFLSGENNAVIALERIGRFNTFLFILSALVLLFVILVWRLEYQNGREKLELLNHKTMLHHLWLLQHIRNYSNKHIHPPLTFIAGGKTNKPQRLKWSLLIFTTFKAKLTNLFKPQLMIKISLVDDHKLFRSGINALLSTNGTYKVVSESDNGKAFIDIVQEAQPEIVMMDLEMPEMDGMETTKVLKEKFPEVKVIMLSMHDDEKFIAHMMSIGARGYLLKNADPEEIELAINSVAETGYFFTDLVSRATLQGLTNGGKVKPSFKPGNDLTERELEVLQLICREKTAAEIGEALFISPRTVEGHRNNIILKTGARNTAGIVVFAMKNGLFEM